MNVNLKIFDIEKGIDIPYNDLCDLVYNAITAAVASKSTNDPLSWEGRMREELDDLCATIQNSEVLNDIAARWIHQGYGLQWFGDWPGIPRDPEPKLSCSTGFMEIDELLESHPGVIRTVLERVVLLEDEPPETLDEWLAWIRDEVFIQRMHIAKHPEEKERIDPFLEDLLTIDNAISDLGVQPSWYRTTWAGVQDNDIVCVDNYQDGEFPNANPKISGPYQVVSTERRLLQRDIETFMYYPDNLIKLL